MRHLYRLITLSLLISLLLSVTAGCSSGPNHEVEHSYALASLADMPPAVHNAPVTVQQAYQFATANPDVLEQLPCYCGCGPMGHTSNYSCYVASTDENGALTYDYHALGCSICVDITQDAMRLLDQGKTVPEIFAYVDSAYAQFGPPTPLDK